MVARGEEGTGDCCCGWNAMTAGAVKHNMAATRFVPYQCAARIAFSAPRTQTEVADVAQTAAC